MMTAEQWLGLQDQLWGAFGPLVSWFLTFLVVGFVAATLFLFGAIFFSDWLDM
jgi:hypothetical protein